MIEFHCEKIPSINNTYVRGVNGVFKNKDVRAYQADLTYFCQLHSKEYRGLFLKEKLEVNIVFGVKNKNRDLDNMLKSTLDAMQGICFRNDCQIYRLVVEKEITTKPYEYVLIDMKEFKPLSLEKLI